MASHAPAYRRAEALPLAAVLSSARRYPRPIVERLVARLIAHLDQQDGDPDLEEDDPPEENGDFEAVEYDYHPIERRPLGPVVIVR